MLNKPEPLTTKANSIQLNTCRSLNQHQQNLEKLLRIWNKRRLIALLIFKNEFYLSILVALSLNRIFDFIFYFASESYLLEVTYLRLLEAYSLVTLKLSLLEVY